MEYIDSHCHITMDRFDEDRNEILADYFESGGLALMSVATGREDHELNRELLIKWDNLYTSLGWHPHDARDFGRREEEFLLNAIEKNEIQAVGEIGLDYHYNHSERAEQLRAFDRQMAIAGKAGLPVIVHTRESDRDTMDMLKRHQKVRGILHCYTSGRELMEIGLKLDYFVSFSGLITFQKTAADIRELLKLVPLDRLLFETDSPYLAPIPYRGKRNDPRKVVQVIKEAARLRGMPPETLSDQANHNFFQLFRSQG